MSFRVRSSLLFILLTGLIALAAVACTGGEDPTANSSQQPTATTASGDATPTVSPQGTTEVPLGEGQALIRVGHHDSLGDILVDNDGMTLYLFTRDEPGVSNCGPSCVGAWPPVLTEGEPLFEITSAELGTITRDDGSTQVTVNGLPVYYYAGDAAQGDAEGQGIGDQWYVMDASGEAVTSEPAASNGENEGVATTISGFAFQNLTVNPGTTVTWTNQDGVAHTVTQTNGSAVDSGSIGGGNTFSFTFDEAGRYEYFCEIHPSMTGVLVVTVGGPDTSTPTPAATPSAVPATSTPTPNPAPAATSTSTPAPAATSTPVPTEDPLGEQYSADIVNFTHEVFTISAGATVTWTNRDNAGHTVTSGTPDNQTSEFGSSILVQNDTYALTFDQPGEFVYFCQPHPFMRGRVIVE